MTFTLRWVDGREQVVEGADITSACKEAFPDRSGLLGLDIYEVGGNKIQVSEIALCDHPAEEGACYDDLSQAGLEW